jgi:molybdopterin-guanine dinucleotide biosynthesis protein A
MSNLTVAIMAGGASSRMGTDKAFVPLLGKPMIEHILDRTANLGQDTTLLITNSPHDFAYLKLPIYTDHIPGKGPLGGIYTALHHSPTNDVLAVACDMPFLNPALLRYMIGLRSEDGSSFDVIVPRVNGYPQGLHAIYRTTCLQPIRETIDSGKLKLIGFYENVRVRYLDEVEYEPYTPGKRSFYNINTPEELQAAQNLDDTSVRSEPNP